MRRNKEERQHASGPRRVQGGASRFGRLAIVLAVCASLAALTLTGCSAGNSTPKAAIVDQLSAREPDPAFVEAATATLEQAGYAVDYYPAEQVTVSFYRDLPTHDYDLIVLRAHSAIPEKDLALPADVPQDILQRIMDRIGDDVLLFTSEPYSDTTYVDEQKALRLFPVVYAGETAGDAYFAITSDFIASIMRGKFDGTTVVLMGCSSLASNRTAAALANKGAEAVVGWSDTVSPSHTDKATERLLQYLLVDGLPVAEAVEKTMAELGPDPSFGAEMLSYPSGD